MKKQLFPVFKSLWAGIVLLYSTSTGSAQVNQNDWDRLNTEYSQRKLNDTTYFNLAEALAEKSFKDVLLKEHLELYKKIAWRKKQYIPYRYKYYAYLANNATFTQQDGAAIYYLEKSEEALKKTRPYINSLNEARQLLTIYGKNESANLGRRKEIFTNVLPFLKTLPQLIINKEVPANTCTNAMTILNIASRLYSGLNDTGMVNKIETISLKILTSLHRKGNFPKDKWIQCQYLYLQVRYTATLLYQDFKTAKAILDSSYSMLESDTAVRQVWKRSVERALLRKYIDFFIAQGQADSSRYYVQLLGQKINKNDPGDGTAQLLYTAKVKALTHNFESAYGDLLEAYKMNDSIISLKTADINNNLYARLIAEQKQEEVIMLQEQKQKRSIIIAIASFIVAAGIALLILKMRRKEKKAQEKIEHLKKLTQMEIAELDIKANLIQRKLGMELHNDIAGKLVYLCNNIDRNIIGETNENFRSKLQNLSDLARATYLDTRNKSHELYAEGTKEEQTAFYESIHKLASYALPDSQFKTVIEIDDASLQKLEHPVKIGLLHIVQEAFANILKHSGATRVWLYIYGEDDLLQIQIKDNGKGFDTKSIQNKKGIGLLALQNKVRELGGKIDIRSSVKETEMNVVIPV